MNNKSPEDGRAKQKHSLILFILLFVFWFILSGHTDPRNLSIGFVSAVVITIITRPLLELTSSTDSKKIFFAFDFPYLKYLAYWPWLLWEMLKANIEIAIIVLKPSLPIKPQILTFRKEMSNPHAHVVLANSITLTPGTITVDIEDNLYTVHALTDSAAKGLLPDEGEGRIPAKISSVFSEKGVQVRSERC